jgi:hypothetical protein
VRTHFNQRHEGAQPLRLRILMTVIASRRQWVLLLLVVALALVSYLSFDTYIRPRSTAVRLDYSGPTEPPASQSRILLVSALFPLSKAKHSEQDYETWLSRFLQPITSEIYFFTTPDMEPIVRSARGDLPITINTSFSSPFGIPPLAGLQDRYLEMRKRDRESSRHSPELYAVWNGKPYYLDEAVKNSAGKYDYAFWTDAGSFRRQHEYAHWPDVNRVDEVWNEGSLLSDTPKEDLLFFPMWAAPHPSMRYWQEAMGPVDNEFIEGRHTIMTAMFYTLDKNAQVPSLAVHQRRSVGGAMCSMPTITRTWTTNSSSGKTRH